MSFFKTIKSVFILFLVFSKDVNEHWRYKNHSLISSSKLILNFEIVRIERNEEAFHYANCLENIKKEVPSTQEWI